MKSVVTLALWAALTSGVAFGAEQGPADRLWELYKEGRFEDVVREGKVELATGTPTAQVNLAVGRALVDLEKFGESLVYLETAVRQDPDRTWVYAWGQVYLGAAHFRQGRLDEAKTAWTAARDCAATRNATRNATNNLMFLGLDDYYDDWKSFTTQHFAFTYAPGLTDFDIVAYARRHEEAYAAITAWFGGGPADKIRFFVWADNAEASAAGMPTLGFSRPEANLVHATWDQTVGHEMTHVISARALEPSAAVGLINEGTAVYHDQTGRDQLARARAAMAGDPDADSEADSEGRIAVSVAALWEDWSLLPAEISYPLAGAWIKVLVEKGGRDKFLGFFRDQRLAHARQVYGPGLQMWMEDFDADLYR
jgi:hypothetical protein